MKLSAIYKQYAHWVGNSPSITIPLIGLLSTLLIVGWLKHVAYTDGLHIIIDFTTQQAVVLMALAISVILLILAFRILSVNTIVSKKVKALHRQRQVAQSHIVPLHKTHDKEDVSTLVAELGAKGNFFVKFSDIVRWHPEPFATLLLVLLSCWIWNITIYYCEPPTLVTLHSWGWRNNPWLSLIAVVLYLIYNDWWIIQELEDITNSLLNVTDTTTPTTALSTSVTPAAATTPEPASPLVLIGLLTPTEKTIYQLRFVEKKPLKDIAALLYVSLSTVKTHINNINKKLNDSKKAAQISEA